jgi:hypothetical protein
MIKMANVRFYSGTRAQYDSLVSRNPLALYFCDDTGELFKGDICLSDGIRIVQTRADLPECSCAADGIVYFIAETKSGFMVSPDRTEWLQTIYAPVTDAYTIPEEEMYTTVTTVGAVRDIEKKIYDRIEDVAANGGVSNLVPVDGTISITDTADGGKAIGVAISKLDGNALVAVSDGLFIKAPEDLAIPEYSIERQAEAEAGFVATYRLKKVDAGVESYVGDSINIAKDLVLKSATIETVTENGVPYAEAKVGDPYIKLEFNDESASALYVPVKGLVDAYTAGSGIEIVDNKISVKLAADTHGLVAVDGALTLNLATKTSDGAMSKEDKKAIDAVPYAYVAKKYDISDLPNGTLVNYYEKEIRIMCPTNAEFKKQEVGVGGDANSYYMTFKTYAPNDRAVGYIEHLNDQSDSEILTKFSVDKHGRRYQSTWLSVAKYNETTGNWDYYGKESSVSKYIGYDYGIDWFDENNVMIATSTIRINLSNEDCHNNVKPYYMTDYVTSGELNDVKVQVEGIVEQQNSWEEW